MNNNMYVTYIEWTWASDGHLTLDPLASLVTIPGPHSRPQGTVFPDIDIQIVYIISIHTVVEGEALLASTGNLNHRADETGLHSTSLGGRGLHIVIVSLYQRLKY